MSFYFFCRTTPSAVSSLHPMHLLALPASTLCFSSTCILYNFYGKGKFLDDGLVAEDIKDILVSLQLDIFLVLQYNGREGNICEMVGVKG